MKMITNQIVRPCDIILSYHRLIFLGEELLVLTSHDKHHHTPDPSDHSWPNQLVTPTNNTSATQINHWGHFMQII